MTELQLHMNKAGVEYLSDAVTGDITSKRCTKCSEMKPLTEFGKNVRGWGGAGSSCKSCINKRNQQRREAVKARAEVVAVKQVRKVTPKPPKVSKAADTVGTPSEETIAKATKTRRKQRQQNAIEDRLSELDHVRTGKERKEISFIDRIIDESYYACLKR